MGDWKAECGIPKDSSDWNPEERNIEICYYCQSEGTKCWKAEEKLTKRCENFDNAPLRSDRDLVTFTMCRWHATLSQKYIGQAFITTSSEFRPISNKNLWFRKCPLEISFRKRSSLKLSLYRKHSSNKCCLNFICLKAINLAGKIQFLMPIFGNNTVFDA